MGRGRIGEPQAGGFRLVRDAGSDESARFRVYSPAVSLCHPRRGACYLPSLACFGRTAAIAGLMAPAASDCLPLGGSTPSRRCADSLNPPSSSQRKRKLVSASRPSECLDVAAQCSRPAPRPPTGQTAPSHPSQSATDVHDFPADTCGQHLGSPVGATQGATLPHASVGGEHMRVHSAVFLLRRSGTLASTSSAPSLARIHCLNRGTSLG